MNNFVKAVLFSISTALVAAPAMAAPQHQDKVAHSIQHKSAPAKHVQHKQPVKHSAKKVAKKHHHTAVKKAPAHHVVKHDVKHR